MGLLSRTAWACFTGHRVVGGDAAPPVGRNKRKPAGLSIRLGASVGSVKVAYTIAERSFLSPGQLNHHAICTQLVSRDHAIG